jgi:hypothetical protein
MLRDGIAINFWITQHAQHIRVAKDGPTKKLAVGHRTFFAHGIVCRTLVCQQTGTGGIPIRNWMAAHVSSPIKRRIAI